MTSTLWQTALGVAGDIPVPSAFVKQTGANPAPTPAPQPTTSRAAIGRARLSPKNATGGTDLYSKNFSWGTGLVNLPGRAGMDAGLSLSYNSLVWTKVGNEIIYDADKGNVAPGFRFGFPVIEPIYTDELTYIPTFLLIAPSGSRTELRQVGTSNFYEAADSSYLQLERTVGGTSEQQQFILRSTDGTQLKYVWRAGAYRCAEVIDSNGNRITVNHDGAGVLRTITDTLNRVITVNYDNALNPTSITQGWGGGVTHFWASFSYTTKQINHNFSGVTVAGPANNSSIKVLERVTFADNSTVRFDYNSYGQVTQVNNYAPNESKLNHVAAEYAASASDCPRFWQTKSLVKNVNGVGDQETVVTNSTTENQSYSVPGTTGSATLIQVSMNGHPNSAVSKTYVGASGWQEGLPIVTEDWADGVKKRWTWTNYTQDDPNLSYIKNPRVIETKVGDETNTKRTTISYHPQFGLVNEVKQYQADQTTVIKRSTTSYNLDAAYTSRRIIGLPQESNLFDGANNLMSKVTYAYDGYDFSGTEQNISPVQHDPNYSAGFIVGRGNLTGTTRWRTGSDDTTSPVSIVVSSNKYNTAGAVVSQTNPMNRSISISYADVFSDTQGTNTFAYPTKITDPSGYFSQVKYRHDIGANVWAKSPNLNANTPGKETTREFDSVGRLQKETIVNNGAYTRYQYFPNQIQTRVFATFTSGAGEAMSETWTDGAGRGFKSRTELPNSAGGWSGSLVEYDILGRTKRSSLPTEITVNETTNVWTPAGDDYRGLDQYNNPVWLWTSQEYDWKGRVTRTVNTDGTDTLIGYEGCGCAGGQVTTVQGELVPRDDQPTVNTRRTQKVYADIQGRTYKTEVMNWDGVTPYTTTINTFNGRDQVTNIRQYAGAVGSSTFQDVPMSYDGHGRMKTRHYPIEDANTNTTWIYNADDSVQQVIDPRGAITNFTYDDPRGLLTNISSTVPANNPAPPDPKHIPQTPSVSFGYDNAGNRTSMADGTGSTSYVYNSLSQLTSETKTFTGLSGNFTLGYNYQLAGGLKSITDPFQSTVNYANDKTGRLTGVSGTAFGNNTSGNYIDGIQYRAFGAIKQMTYKTGDNALVSMQYDNRLRVSSYQVASAAVAGGFVQKSGFEYFADSRPKAVDNVLDAGFDRTFKYDFAGRLTNNQFGTGTRPDGQQFTIYSQMIAYDAFSQMTSRQTGIWSGNESFTAAYTNGRRQAASGESLVFDALGNIVDITYSTGRVRFERSQFDAAGRMAEFSKRQQYGGGQTTFHDITKITTQFYDGDGERVKEVERDERTQNPAPPGVQQPVITEEAKYFIRSSVTGKVISELDAAGGKTTTKVYVGSAVLAEQRIYPATQQNPEIREVIWQHGDPVTGSIQQTLQTGAPAFYVAPKSRRELEPLGGVVPISDPYYSEEINEPEYNYGGDVRRPEFGCTLPDSGQPAPCNVAAALMNYLDGITPTTGNLGNYFRSQAAGRMIPGFIRADNRRDDELQQIPGLRFAPQYEGREYVGSRWVENSTAAQGQTQQPPTQEKNNPNDCEKFLAGTFTDDPKGTTFVDVTDGDGYDPIQKANRTPADKISDEHNHFYNSPNDPQKATNIFVPAGGRVIGSGLFDKSEVSPGQLWISLYYRSLGGMKNVILQLWHVENYNGKGGVLKDGRIQLGQMGKNGEYPYYILDNPGQKTGLNKGWHVHIQAFKWWGKIGKKGKLRGDPLGLRSVKSNYRLKLSDIFCKKN